MGSYKTAWTLLHKVRSTAGASHMNQAVPTVALRRLGLVSLLEEHQRLVSSA